MKLKKGIIHVEKRETELRSLENSNKDIFWVTVTLSSSQSILSLPLHQKLTSTLHTCRHTVYHLGSKRVLFAFLGNLRLHHCKPVSFPGSEKKKKNTLYFCHICLLRVNSGFLWQKAQWWMKEIRVLESPSSSLTPGAPILGLLCCLYSLCDGESGYDFDHQNQSQTSYPHAFLSQPSLLSWLLLLFYNHTQTLRYLGCGHKDYLLSGLHDAILLWLHTCD